MADSSAAEHAAAEALWVPDATEGYVLAEEMEEPAGEGCVMVRVMSTGETKIMRRGEPCPQNPANQDGVEDNTALLHLHEAGLLHNLRHRYAQGDIYTYTAYILIAINPYRTLDIYTDWQKYVGKSIGLLPPHVFAVADRAHRMMRAEKKSQSVVISGESGSGKTESSKYLMRYLANVGAGGADGQHTGAMIVDSNPILEAIGNAKTMRNNNSSRFGKFIEMNFNKAGQVLGATIQTYLLEKSRLVHQDEGERNYHVFYQLCAGAEAHEREQLHIGGSADYHYLNQSSCASIDGVDDAGDFHSLRKAMHTMNIDNDAQLSFFRLLSGLLRLGNVKFGKVSEAGDAGVLEEAFEQATLAARLLNIEVELLEKRLCTKRMVVNGEQYEVPLNVQAASYARDALTKAVYGRLFDWVVERINKELLTSQEDVLAFIGVLDIFGFEMFQVNSFEQLCINYANEKLQQYFNVQVLCQEQEIYEKEGIKWRTIEYVDNQDCIDLLEQPGQGILANLDEEQRMPKATDVTFTDKVYQRHGKHPRLKAPKLTRGSGLTRSEAFSIRHFAGEVTYCTAGFLDKNNDVLHEDLEEIVASSQCPLLRFLYTKTAEAATPVTTPGRGKAKAAQTVASKFYKQLQSLMKSLQSTSSHFVRCVKPNDVQRPGVFEGSKVVAQLRCGGMLEALRLLHAGFPTRCPFDDLYDRYAHMMPKEIQGLDSASFCEALLMALDLRKTDYAMGITKVFFRAGKLAFLEDLNGSDYQTMAPQIVAKIKKWLVRKRLRRLIFSVYAGVKCGTRLRMMRAGERFRRTAAVVTIIHMLFFPLARKIKMRRAACRIQATWAMWKERSAYLTFLAGLVQLQALAKGRSVMKCYGPQLAALRQKRLDDIKRREEEEKERVRAERQAEFEEQKRKIREAEERRAEADNKRRAAAQEKKLKEEQQAEQAAAQAAELAAAQEELARLRAGSVNGAQPVVQVVGEATAAVNAGVVAATALPMNAQASQEVLREMEAMREEMKELSSKVGAVWEIFQNEQEKWQAQMNDVQAQVTKLQTIFKRELESKASKEPSSPSSPAVRASHRTPRRARTNSGREAPAEEPSSFSLSGLKAPSFFDDMVRVLKNEAKKDDSKPADASDAATTASTHPGPQAAAPTHTATSGIPVASPAVSSVATPAAAASEKPTRNRIMSFFKEKKPAASIADMFRSKPTAAASPAKPASSPMRSPQAGSPGSPMNPAKARLVELQESVEQLQTHFSGLGAAGRGSHAELGRENKHLHALVRGQLCSALHHVFTNGFRVWTVPSFQQAAAAPGALPKRAHLWDFLMEVYHFCKANYDTEALSDSEKSATRQRRNSADRSAMFAAYGKGSHMYAAVAFVHAVDQLASLPQLRTKNDAKFRAWVVSALNSSLLAAWLALIFEQQQLLEKWFEPWAFFRVKEHCIELRRMAQHLCELPFAMQVDYEVSMMDM